MSAALCWLVPRVFVSTHCSGWFPRPSHTGAHISAPTTPTAGRGSATTSLPHHCTLCTFACATLAEFNFHVKSHRDALAAADVPLPSPSPLPAVPSLAHASRQPRKCQQCPFIAICDDEMVEHLRRHNANELFFACLACAGGIFPAREVALRHTVLSHPSITYA